MSLVHCPACGEMHDQDRTCTKPDRISLICPECKRPAIEDHNSFWCDHCRRLWPKGSGHELYVSEVPRGPAVEDRHNPAHAVFTLEELNQYYEPCSKPTKNSKTTHGDSGNAPQK